MSSLPLQHALSAERLEGWNPTADHINDLDAALNRTLSRREYLERALARSRAAETQPTPSRHQSLGLRGIYRRRAVPYLYRGTSVLKNNFDVRSHDALQSLEFSATALRLGEAHQLRDEVPHSRDCSELLALHKHVFQDLYSWSGQIRTVDIKKGSATFASVSTIRNYLSVLENMIADFDWAYLDRGSASYALASVYSTYNHAHPFREGNGRTGTLFLHRLTADTAYHLDLSVITRSEWIAASRDSAPFRPTGTPSARPFVSLFNRALDQPGNENSPASAQR